MFSADSSFYAVASRRVTPQHVRRGNENNMGILVNVPSISKMDTITSGSSRLVVSLLIYNPDTTKTNRMIL